MIGPTIYQIYQGKLLPGFWMHFFLVIRIATTRFHNGAHAKPFLRNLMFNFPRQFYPIIWPWLVLGKPLPSVEAMVD